MDIFSKKTLLSKIQGGGIYGAPAAASTVKFMYTTNLATAASNTVEGGLVFANDGEGHAAIWSNGTLLSSAIQSVVPATQTGNKHGGKTVTITYIVAATGAIATETFNVIDEAGIEAYISGSKTIALDASTDKFEVKVKDEGGIKVDNAGLYVDIADLFGVDDETIGFDENDKLKTLVKLAYTATGIEGEPAIQLQNANDEALSEVTVADLIADGIVESTSYNASTNILTINWKGGAVTTINMAAIIDIDDVFIATDSSNLLTATNDTSVVKIGTTAKMRNAVALAESALQSIGKTETQKTYVDLTVGTKTDSSTQSLEIVETGLVSKFTEVDGSINDISTRFDNYKTANDLSIGRLDASVNAIESAIEAMDATLDASALNGSIGISLVESNGKVTSIGVTAQKATVTFDNTGAEPNLTSTSGLLAGDAVAPIKEYVDTIAQQGFESLDSSINVNSADGSLNFKVVETDGKLTSGEISYVKSTVTYTAEAGETPSNLTATQGFLTGESITAIKSYIDTTVNRQDSSVNDADAKGFIEVSTEMTNGALSAQDVSVTYGAFTVAPGSVTASTQGIADASAVAAAVNGALVWTVL